MVTIVTIALSVLIVGSFMLFFMNTGAILTSWQKGVKIMVYLKSNISDADLPDIKQKLISMGEVQDIRFISKHDALAMLKEQMRHQSSVVENLKENPLPDAFEIHLNLESQEPDVINALSERIQGVPGIDSVEYGQEWFSRFTAIYHLFKFTGSAMVVLFFLAMVFIIANTVRLVLYSRQEEIEIMRLVGATDKFIKTPFYMEGLVQGAVGSFIGISALYAGYTLVSVRVERNVLSGLFQIQFLSLESLMLLFFGSMFVGWLGSYFSLKHFLNQ